MSFEHKRVDPTHADFVALVTELNASLVSVTNDSGESSFSAEEFDIQSDGCVVVYAEQIPVACGVFRRQIEGVCEIKRMYSKRSGAGSYLLSTLEAYATVKGYRKAVLSTRRVNVKAVEFYQRNSYVESEPYGKYVGVDRSICMSKTLQ
ncbi:GNAT family N-acetyltransferase [Vibrio ziniensis]|uniref:GNAT family N-acetyltransferase n=1 Tax=Vibrio ziniensis TaxID=2711221 RepID=A0A6G7CR55_9VIBR|nr:GNAT family N-acetyltransferase [Vibrio ziniensis]QIH44478.1 GNAT family N-acetyltransferase [Vibrio ziniensis]